MDHFSEFAKAKPHIVQGETAVEKGDYAAAAPAFETAAKICLGGLLQLYNAQANALLSAELYEDAKKVTDKSIRLEANSSQAWYLQGNALYKMGQRSSAKKSFEKAASLEKVRALKMNYKDWVNKCDEDSGDDDDDVETIDATGQCARTMPRDTLIGKKHTDTKSADVDSSDGKPGRNVADDIEVKTTRPVENPTKMQWYQSSSHVSIDVYAKNVDREKSSVVFEPSHLAVRLVRPDMENYILDKELSEKIEVDSSVWSVSRYKVEIRMKKAVRGSTWRSLDKEEKVVSAAVQASAESMRRKEMQQGRDKQWNSIAEKELEDYKEDDGPMALFRTLYKDADEDTKRAMMKSYSESGGQVLSTNWEEVQKKKVVYEEKK